MGAFNSYGNANHYTNPNRTNLVISGGTYSLHSPYYTAGSATIIRGSTRPKRGGSPGMFLNLVLRARVLVSI